MAPPIDPDADDAPPPPGPILIESDAGDGVVVVRVLARSLGDAGMAASLLKAEMEGLADRLGPGAVVVVNLTGVDAVSDLALASFVRFWKRLRPDLGGGLAFCEAGPRVAELFRVVRLPWGVAANEDEAISAVRGVPRARRGIAGGDGPPA